MVAPISKTQLENASLDAKSLEDFANGPDTQTVISRLGQTYPSISKFLLDNQANINNALAPTLAANLAIDNDASKGGGMVGFAWNLIYNALSVGWGIVTASRSVNALRYVNIAQWPAIFNYTSTFDTTSALQSAHDTGKQVYVPAGLWNTGRVFLNEGFNFVGDGILKTIFKALAAGGSTANLAAYGAGPIFCRRFNLKTTVTGSTWTISTYTATNGKAQTFLIYNNSATNHSAKTVTITGTDQAGTAQSEVLNLPTASGNVQSVKSYLTVTSIVPSATIGADTMDVCLKNPYVSFGYMADFSVIMNHPAYNASNYKQIAIDLRNITRSTIERVYVGNFADPTIGHPFGTVVSSTNATQGYGFAIGTRPSMPDYCGGEVNTLRDCYAWGCYKNIVIDDATINANSSAHGTLIDNCDIQGGHNLISQESATNAGSKIVNLTIQGNFRQSGNANPTTGVLIAGFSQSAHIKYGELGTACDVLFQFTSTSRDSNMNMDYYSYVSPSSGNILDGGTNNEMQYRLPVLFSGHYSGRGNPVKLRNGGYTEGWAIASISSGVATVIASSFGEVTFTRPGAAGRWRATLNKPMPSATWYGHIDSQNLASGFPTNNPPIRGSQSTTNYEFYSYVNGANADPDFIYFHYKQ